MIPIFEYEDIFDGNSFKLSNEPLINEFQETVKNALINKKIVGYIFDDYGGEEEYIVGEINEYNKFYIFDFLSEKYPKYGFMDSPENNLRINGDFITLRAEPKVIEINTKKEVI